MVALLGVFVPFLEMGVGVSLTPLSSGSTPFPSLIRENRLLKDSNRTLQNKIEDEAKHYPKLDMATQ